MRSEIKLLILGLIGAMVLGFVAISLLSSQQYMSVSDVKKMGAQTREVVVMGKIVNGSITFKEDEISFIIYDKESPNKERVQVIYIGSENIQIHDGVVVVVKGVFDGKVIWAKEVLTKCPSTYEPSKPG